MTLATRCLIAFGLGLALAVATGGCSVNHRSGDFACEKQADCSTGRTCVDGFCVAMQADAAVPGDGKVDAPTTDANLCPSSCTSCSNDSKTCNIDCAALGGACNRPVRCPEGWNCNLLCSTPGSCRNGVTCPGGGLSCDVTCSGRGSCSEFTCNSGPCDIRCTGTDTCTSISCGNACACDINCATDSSCASKITCRSDECRAGRGCTSVSPLPTLCNACVPF
ncbi:MAG TPA: hypothetical protein VLM79_02590 [Kofleriaceae bacterium]|nr:hypothetical protein [Kofleriaceae bacterium]